MLNRRYIRIKVMQALYAWEQAKKANYEIALEHIEQSFTPAWNDEEGRENIQILKKYQNLASKIFKFSQSNSTPTSPKEVQQIVQKAIDYYNNQAVKDNNPLQTTLLDEADKIHDAYLATLLLLWELQEFALYQDDTKNSKKRIYLANNNILKSFKTHKTFQAKISSRKISWSHDFIKNIYTCITQSNQEEDFFSEEKAEFSSKKLETDKELINYIIKNILFDNEEFNNFFNDLDLNWEENHKIVKSMVIHTFKNIKNMELIKRSNFLLASNKREDVYEAIRKAITQYTNQVAKDSGTFQKNLMNEAEKIYNAYLSIILLLSELHTFALNQDTKVDYRQGINLANNSILESLRIHESFQRKISSGEVSWSGNTELVKNIYRKIARKNEGYDVFLQKKIDNAEQKLIADKELISYILKNVLFENQDFQEHFENLDLNWEENYKIVKSMLNRTFKDIKSIDAVENANFPLSNIAKNWEDDQLFFEDLYDYNIEHETKLYKIIEEKAKNWEMERLALIDQIILKMAISEMLYFFSIPIKVSINEYIEISKLYSTPKSKQFINGLLDKTAHHLKEKGEIKKSGRGLMDNK